MLDKKIEAALNKQINHEIGAAYNYLAMAAWFDRQSLSGFSTWMLQQRNDELSHAMRLFRYVLDRGGSVDLDKQDKPEAKFDAVRAVFDRALKLERVNTTAINELFALAIEVKDYATQSHLQWFLDEQVEEEKTMDEILNLLTIAGDDRAALLALNHQMAARATEGG